MSLWKDFMTNRIGPQGQVCFKWTHYFPIYEKHFKEWQNKPLVFWEIGVDRGGSIQMWNRYFGPNARIIGIDIEPRCKAYEEPGINIRIGDQSDTVFLQSIIDEFGAPDIILDDGSHYMPQVLATFQYMYPRVSKNGVYMVEDMHTSYWPEYGGGVNEPGSFINISKQCVDKLNAARSRDTVAPDYITENTSCISFYDSIVVYEKGQIFRREPF